MKRKLSALLLCLLLLLCGCGKQKAEPSTVPPTASSPDSRPTEASQPAPISFRQEQLVTAIELPAMNSIPGIGCIGNGLIAFCQPDYEQLQTDIYLYDVVSHGIVRSVHLDYAGELIAASQEGLLALRCYEDERYVFLNDQLETAYSFSPPVLYGALSVAGEKYYFVQDELLYQTDIQTGETSLLSVPGDLRVSYMYTMDPVSGDLILQLYTDVFTSDTATAVFDPESCSLRFLQGESALASLSGDLISYTDNNWDEDEISFCWGTLTGDAFQLRQASLTDLGLYYPYPQAVISSPYCFIADDMSEQGGGYLCLPEQELLLWSVTELGLPENVMAPTYMPQEGLMIFPAFRNDRAELYLLDPALLPASSRSLSGTSVTMEPIDQQVLENSRSRLVPPALSDEYAQVRSTADRLERTYDIRILLSEQCQLLTGLTSFSFADSSQIFGELENIAVSLSYLENALALYPDDFFLQFKDGTGGGGICVLLTGPIESDYSVIGFEQQLRSWSIITMDISHATDTLGGTFCHEMWHAIEDRAWSRGSGIEWSDRWDACNPEGFAYSYDHTTPVWNEYTYYSYSGQVYFVDDYACTFPTEDRARLMEYVMWYPADAEKILTYSPMREKLSILCDIIRDTFDVSNWDRIYWERYT